ncbi:MAG: hypothetical protein JO076_14350 [Verrucomicrobia bacterium]|nr:hypothetical protein [Verrucomicrobiota bacterium]
MTTATMSSGGGITITATIEGFSASYTRATLFLSSITLQTLDPSIVDGRFYAAALPHFIEYATLESNALH